MRVRKPVSVISSAIAISATLSDTRNRMIASFDGGKRFDYIVLPERGDPFLTNSEGRMLTISDAWLTTNIAVDGAGVAVRQVSFLRAPFYPTEGDFPDMRLFDAYFFSFKGLPDCPLCEPIMFRKLVSTDRARTFQLSDYGILRPENLPADAQPLKTGLHVFAEDFEARKQKPEPCPPVAELTPRHYMRGCVLVSNVNHERDQEWRLVN